MPLNPIELAIERMRENESLTDNLTDDLARALLVWAEQQIRKGIAFERVVSAMRAANHSQATTREALILIAQRALKAAQPARPVTM